MRYYSTPGAKESSNSPNCRACTSSTRVEGEPSRRERYSCLTKALAVQLRRLSRRVSAYAPSQFSPSSSASQALMSATAGARLYAACCLFSDNRDPFALRLLLPALSLDNGGAWMTLGVALPHESTSDGATCSPTSTCHGCLLDGSIRRSIGRYTARYSHCYEWPGHQPRALQRPWPPIRESAPQTCTRLVRWLFTHHPATLQPTGRACR